MWQFKIFKFMVGLKFTKYEILLRSRRSDITYRNIMSLFRVPIETFSLLEIV